MAITADYVEQAEAQDVDVLLFPELALSGYPAGAWYADCSLTVNSPHVRRLRELSKKVAIVTGFIEETEDVQFYNSAMYLSGGQIRHVHRKLYPPNYRLFDEGRYFGTGWTVQAFDTPWARMAILICGDCWHLPLPYMAVHDGADVLLFLAASSNEGLSRTVSCQYAWERMNRSYALTLSSFVVFANHAGVKDDLHFWGGSHMVLPDGNFLAQAQIGEPELLITELDMDMLRRQRLILPFRRDDKLSLTVDMGQRILAQKGQRRDGFASLTSPLPRRRNLPADDTPAASNGPSGTGPRPAGIAWGNTSNS